MKLSWWVHPGTHETARMRTAVRTGPDRPALEMRRHLGPKLVQEVILRPDETVIEREPATSVYNSGAQWQFMVFDAATPQTCLPLTNPDVGALPGTLLVTLTWSRPELLTR
jgi:hypothetical protein